MEKDLLYTTKFYSCSALKIALVSFIHAHFHAIKKAHQKNKICIFLPR